MAEKKHCDFVEGCPMFKYFRKIAKMIYVETYCQGEYFDTCARRKLRLAGQPVPDNLLPHGSTLWNSEEKPPPLWEY